MNEGSGQLRHYGMRAEQFSALMAFRVSRVLLVASRYDAFLLQEEGQLAELLAREYRNLEINLRHVPRFHAAESGEEALERVGRAAAELGTPRPFDLVVTTTRLPDMPLATFGKRLKEAHPDLPLGVLAPHAWEMPRLAGLRESGAADWIYLWQGDAKTLVAMIEQEEDRRNAQTDVLGVGVRVIIVVEDDVRFLSYFLPHLYAEITAQTSRLMAEGLNLSHRLLRLRARPKILLAHSFEEAWKLWKHYGDKVLALIADAGFPRAGKYDAQAGIELARRVHQEEGDLPVLLQSAEAELKTAAHAVGTTFVHKSADVVEELRRFLLDACGFGDFVFRRPDRSELERAATLRELVAALERVPESSIEYHASRNHFSRWFAARTEFALADMVRPVRVSQFATLGALRQYLVATVAGYLREIQRTIVADFDAERFDEFVAFARIGEGALGGKGRGLAFVQRLLSQDTVGFGGVEVVIPQTLVVATDVFERYLEENHLRALVPRLANLDDAAVLDAFRQGRFEPAVRAHLAAYLRVVREPIAVRSSSILEDSPYQPFAGVYTTIMLPNNHPSLDVRLAQLLEAIKVVYASTYMRAARGYLATTPHRIEEERMAVLLQRLVGSRHGDRFYPLVSGVASSYNFYPFRDMTPNDGVALVALGLGKTVVEGFEALRFCPAHPQVLPQFSSVKDVLRHAQRRFWALDMTSMDLIPGLDADANLVSADVGEALTRPEASLVASTWVRANDVLVDGLARDGVPLVTFARLLKGREFSLPQVLEKVLSMTQAGMGMPVEIEFAAHPGAAPGPPVFHVLQVRPMVVEPGLADPDLESLPDGQLLVTSSEALGNGRSSLLYDVVVVHHDLERGRTPAAATALERLNSELRREARPYLLIGPGRWGSRDPWLGIPVIWGQISGASAIVEVDFDDLEVEPSQGSHFFHNLTSFGIPFLPVHRRQQGGCVRWEWLQGHPAQSELLDGKIRHLRLERPVRVLLNGPSRRGVVVLEAD